MPKTYLGKWSVGLTIIFFLLIFSMSQGKVYGTPEEIEGKAIWEKQQAKQLECKNLTDNDFELLGEYFMDQMLAPSGAEGAGSSHEAMNKMMEQMMGRAGEEQMHIVMGKRLSGCDSSAVFPSQGVGFMSMMNMLAPYRTEGSGSGMMGGGMMEGGDNSMMGNFGTNPMSWFGWGFGWVFMILFWGLVILTIVALIKWIMNQGKGEIKSKSALDILKERYARGEIGKKEFEERKKDLG